MKMHLYCQHQPGKFDIYTKNYLNFLKKYSKSYKKSRTFKYYRFPFDWKNLIGYLIAVLFEYILTFYMFIFVEAMLAIGIAGLEKMYSKFYMAVYIGGLLNLSVAAFLYEVTIIREMKNNLNSIIESSDSHKCRLKITKKFSDFIEIHSTMKQLRNVELRNDK